MKDSIRYLVDAGPLIGVLDKDDQWHRWSRETFEILDEQVATTELVLAEACHRVRRLRPALDALWVMIAAKRVKLLPIAAEQASRIRELLKKYPEMDAGDATLVVLSEMLPDAKVITLDRDFLIYRRFRDQPIPIISPRH